MELNNIFSVLNANSNLYPELNSKNSLIFAILDDNSKVGEIKIINGRKDIDCFINNNSEIKMQKFNGLHTEKDIINFCIDDL